MSKYINNCRMETITRNRKTAKTNTSNYDNSNTNKPLYEDNKIYTKEKNSKEDASIQIFSRNINEDEKNNENVTKKDDDIDGNNSNDNKMSDREKNELSYFEAKIKDKRDFLTMLFSIIFNKIGLVQNILYPEEYSHRLLLFNLYILSSYMDLLMNCLLYNDYALSQKYHCNGELEFITSLVISLVANVFSFIILYCIEFLTNFPALIEAIINEIKDVDDYLRMLVKFFKIIKIKIFALFIVETIFGLFMVYYITIFSAIYSNSINSFLLNYLFSQLESLLYSVCLSIIIAFMRRISLLCHYHKLYVISLYFNQHF